MSNGLDSDQGQYYGSKEWVYGIFKEVQKS